MNELIDKVLQWGVDKGITGPDGKGTPIAQADKMLEEASETWDAVEYLEKLDSRITFEENDHPWFTEDDVKDGIGDTCVTLILLAEMHGWTLEECLQEAYDVISKRTGKMKNGAFVKDV